MRCAASVPVTTSGRARCSPGCWEGSRDQTGGLIRASDLPIGPVSSRSGGPVRKIAPGPGTRPVGGTTVGAG